VIVRWANFENYVVGTVWAMVLNGDERGAALGRLAMPRVADADLIARVAACWSGWRRGRRSTKLGSSMNADRRPHARYHIGRGFLDMAARKYLHKSGEYHSEAAREKCDEKW
jgi:hypothetical protein